MFYNFKSAILTLILLTNTLYVLADRGGMRKTKNKVSLNISSTSGLRSSLFTNLKSGLTYRGSILLKKSYSTVSGTSTYNNTIVTFQKGNTVYILPYKNKAITAEVKQGYTGTKVSIPFGR